MTSPTYKLIRRRSSLDTGELMRALLNAADPQNEIESFHAAILSTARARQNALGNPTSESLNFALDTLLPFRQQGIERYLDRAAVDHKALAEFLGHLRELAGETILASGDAEDIADAATVALDDLHAYLLAHRLLAEGYIERERALAQRLLDAREDGPPEPGHDHEPDRVAVDARESELALAA